MNKIKKKIQEKIKNNILDKTWKRCVVVFLIIFLLVVVGGALSIDYLGHVIMDKNVHVDTIIVKDKFIGNDTQDDYYIITDMNNKTYIIDNNDMGYDKQIYNTIKVGEKYRVTMRDSPNDTSMNIHILQVHNDTG